MNGGVEAYVEPDGTGGRRSVTFAEWDRAADGVAGHLARLGVAKGDVVCLLLPSSIEYAVLYAALLRLGAITSGINPRMGAGEVASIVERAAPVLLVLDPETGLRHDAGTVEVVTRAEARSWWGEEGPDSWPQLASSDPVAVVWTSGTTGRPKGALFDHANLAAVARGTDVLSHPGDRRLSPLPFAHVGYMTRAWDEIGNAVTTVITPTPWRADDAIHVMADEAVTVAQGVPTQWALMLASEALPRSDLSTLRVAGTGAARMTASMVAEVRRRFGVPVVVRYTSTESSLGTGTTLTSSDEEVATTVGRPVAGVELAIVDDDGDPVPAGSVGRVLLRSGAVMRGYWGRGPGRGRSVAELVDASATGAVLAPNGWLTTGDFGRLTPEGNLQLSGRAHERYIRGGYNVYPAEVEEALSSHPAIARAAVVGVADEVLGEVGVAVVVPAPGAQPDLASLRAHCARELSDYKAPDALVVVGELPLTPMMKVDPVRLAALAGARSGGSPAGLGAKSSARRWGARQWPHRRRRREGARMSPTTRVGESDPNRGTAPEAITPGRYTGRVAVVTGSGSGIGRATARRLAAEGAAVACLDVTTEAIEAVAAEINTESAEAGGRAIAVRCDVTDEDGVGAAVARAAEELGPITNLCNIAGVGGFAHTPDQSLSGWDKIIAVNLTGTFLMCRAVLPGMLELDHGGAIVNTISTAGMKGQPYSAAYCASKGGARLLTMALAVEYMARGVRVNGVAPGGVDTPIIHNFGPPADADWKLIERLMSPIGFAYPHEVAGAFAYLGSSEADYITGAILSIDGAITT